jgi:hypothetical protein
MQASDELLPVKGLYVPRGHNVQSADTEVGLYVPAGQDVHADWPAPL